MRAFIIIFLLVSMAGGIEENNSSHEMVALQEILDSYHFIYKPQLDVFDCVDMAVANYRFLKSQGYETLITIVEDGSMLNGTRLGHCMAPSSAPGRLGRSRDQTSRYRYKSINWKADWHRSRLYSCDLQDS